MVSLSTAEGFIIARLSIDPGVRGPHPAVAYLPHYWQCQMHHTT
jgi:hypothetical protein